MKINKRNIIFIGIIAALVNSNIVLAITPQELNNYVLDVYSERYVASNTMEKFLKTKGVKISEYKKYLKELSTYSKSKEVIWEKIENGSLIIDEILFSDKNVKKEYEKALKRLKSDRLAYEFVKKNMINNPNKFISKFETDIKNLKKVRDAIEDKYDRKITEVEAAMLEKFDTFKYVLYMTVNGGHFLPQNEEMSMDKAEDLIKDGYGYRLLELNDSDIEKYKIFMKKRDKYDEMLIEYYKSYSMMQSIYEEIIFKYDKSIYKELTDKERLNIYEKSIDGFIFDEEKARKKVLNLLVKKGSITKEEINKAELGVVEQESAGKNPWEELKKKLKNKNKNRNTLSGMYSSSGVNDIHENLMESFVSIKYKDKEIDTQIRLEKGNKLKDSMLNELIKELEEKTDVKMIFSKDKILTFLDNLITTSEFLVKDNEIEFKKVVDAFDKTGIKIYLKDIDYTQFIEIEEDTDLECEYKVVLNFEDKMIEYSLGEKKELSKSKLYELLDALNIKVISSIDSTLILNDNKLKVSKELIDNKESISINDLKTLFEDINEKVNIQVIKEGV